MQERATNNGVEQAAANLERQGTGSQQREVFPKLSPGTSAPSNSSCLAASASTKHVAQITESVHRLQDAITHLHFLDRAPINRADTRCIATSRAGIVKDQLDPN